MTTKRAAGELVAAALAGLGVREVFALHGSHLDPLFVACSEFGIRLTDTRHEASAGHAADGYARASNGKLGVCAVTAGPGFTNALTAIANAYLDRIPTMFIAGAAPLREAEANTLQGGFDAIAMARPVTKWAARVSDPHRIVEYVRRAGEIALSGSPGPVFLEIPIDVMFWPIEDAPPDVSTWVRPAPAAPAADAVQALVALLRTAERPVIIAGGGAVLSNSASRLKAFAEMTATPVIASQKALGILPDDHPLYAGAAAGLAAAASVGQPADAVLLVGARQGMFLGGAMGAIIPQSAKLAQIEANPEEIGRVRMADIAVVADAARTLDALIEAAKGMKWKKRSAWASTLREFRARPRAALDAAPKETAPGRIHPGHAVAAVMDALPHGTAVVTDGGEAGNWVGDLVRSPGGGQHLRCGYLGCLGVSPGFAIGAARADPSRPVVCFAGDGGAGFNIQELDTMMRHKLPIVTVVLNNAEWGMSRNAQNLLYGRQREVIVALAETHFETVGEGFGVPGVRVDRYEDIMPAVRKAFEAGEPRLINLMIDPAVMHPRTRMMVGDVSGADGVPIPYYANIPNKPV
jgi:acetolactate synthase-1/2/3 large subunit